MAFLFLFSRLLTSQSVARCRRQERSKSVRRRKAAKPRHDSQIRDWPRCPGNASAVKDKTAPRASKVTVLLAPDSVVRVLLAPSFDVIVDEFGGAPAGRRVTNPLIKICFSVGSTVTSLFESVQTIQSVPNCLIWQLICVFRRTASNRVNFNSSDRRAAASLSW